MSMLRQVFLLLSVAVLLREGSSNSPLDFLRDLKNRIFTSSNSTESTEEPSVQCSGLDQDGVCTSQETAVNRSLDENDNIKSTDTFDNPDLSNGSLTSDPDMFATGQPARNGTVAEETYDTNNTQYYDEQVWNSTATNITDNDGNDFEYPDNGQNGTDLNSEAPAANGEEINKQTENTRSKRQISTVEINITLKSPGATSKPQTLSTTILTGKSENTSINKLNNETEGKRVIANSSKNNTTSVLNEPIATDDNQTIVMTESTGNEKEENTINEQQKTNYSTSTTSDSSQDLVILSSNDTISDLTKSQITKEETGNDESTSINCTDCVAAEKSTNLKNISLSLDEDFNGTELTDDGHIDENSTQINNNYITGQTNITKLKDILENSTRVIENIVLNIVPAIFELGSETNADGKNDTKLENTGVQNTKTTEEQTNSSETIKFNNTEAESGDKIDDGQLNPTTNQTNITHEDHLNTTTDTSNGSLHVNSIKTNESVALGSNTTDNAGVKREKRNINFTILSEDDEESDFSAPTFPDSTESPAPATELPSITMTNSTESSSLNGTQEIEIVGPVCVKRYEQCKNSTDCCDDYECIGTGKNNTTSYCDLRPVNLTLSTSLPLREDNAE